nr:DMT family transporter [Cysteiniphilum sp. 19X3-34]
MVITTIVWGLGFVAQKYAMGTMQPFFFNAIRFSIGAVALMPMALCFKSKHKHPKQLDWQELRTGIICGVILFTAATMQQIGICYTTASKTSFITGMYIVLVPILGLLLFKQKTRKLIFVTTLTALVGLGLLVLNKNLTIKLGDSIVFIGAIFWALHVLYICKVSAKYNALRLTIYQIMIASLISYFFAFMLENITIKNIYLSAVPLLYSGILATGVAYLFQIIGQRYVSSTNAALILSSESVFGALGSMVILGESLSIIQIIGCIIMFLSIIIAQLIPNT